MPNWIEGTLKIRGSRKNIERFVTEGLNAYDYTSKEYPYPKLDRDKWLKIDYYKDSDEIMSIYILNQQWVYVEGTSRGFITGEHDIYVYDHLKDDEVTYISDVRQAWGFCIEEWIEIAKKYSIDLRLWGLECGMQFGEEIEIDRTGKLMKYDDIHYTDWDWECPIPFLGG